MRLTLLFVVVVVVVVVLLPLPLGWVPKAKPVSGEKSEDAVLWWAAAVVVTIFKWRPPPLWFWELLWVWLLIWLLESETGWETP